MAIEIVTISGSIRQANYTNKALAIVVDELKKYNDVIVHEIDLGSIEFPFPGRPMTDPRVKEFQQIVRNASGVVIGTPEYHGSFSSLIKLAIENLGYPSALKGKPIALLGVANGRIGAIKSLEHLRSVASHVGALVLPSMVSIDRVRKIFDLDGFPLDENMEIQLRGLANTLVDYIKESICPKFVLEEMMRAEAR